MMCLLILAQYNLFTQAVYFLQSCIAYLIKNFAWLSRCRCCTNCIQHLPGPICQCTLSTLEYNVLQILSRNRFTFGGVIVERVNTAKMHSKVSPVFGCSSALSQIMTVLFWVGRQTLIQSMEIQTVAVGIHCSDH